MPCNPSYLEECRARGVASAPAGRSYLAAEQGRRQLHQQGCDRPARRPVCGASTSLFPKSQGATMQDRETENTLSAPRETCNSNSWEHTQSGRVPGDSCCRPCPGPVRHSPEPGSRIAVALHTTPQHHMCKPTFTRILSLERHLKAQTRNKKINKQNSIPFVDLAINTNNNYILISAICNFPAFRRRGISWTLRTPPEHPRNGRALPWRAGLSSHCPSQARAASLSQQPKDSPHTAGSGGTGVR